MMRIFCAAAFLGASASWAQPMKILKADYQIDSVDRGIRLFVREKKAEGAKAGEDNVVLFIHGATFPSTPDFDLQYKDYSWADWMVQHGYVVYMFDNAKSLGNVDDVLGDWHAPLANAPGGKIDHCRNIRLTRLDEICRKQSRMC